MEKRHKAIEKSKMGRKTPASMSELNKHRMSEWKKRGVDTASVKSRERKEKKSIGLDLKFH